MSYKNFKPKISKCPCINPSNLIWALSCPASVSLWKGIAKELDSFLKLISFKVCNNERVQFWLDSWCSPTPVNVKNPNLFSLVSNKEGSIKDHMIRGQSFYSWNLHFRRDIDDWELEDVSNLLSRLDSVSLGNREDKDKILDGV